MDLRRLRYFVALGEELHFGRAARRVHVVQPALSQQIRVLEEEIGAPLVERTTRRVALTAAGGVLLEHARRVLADVEQAVVSTQRASRGVTGRLAVGFVSPAALRVLPEVLAKFRVEHPSVEMTLLEGGTTDQLKAVEEGRLDIGFVLLPADARKLALEPALAEPLMAVLPAGHRLAGRPSVPLAALADEDIIWMARRSEPRLYELYTRLCLEAGFSPRVAHEVDHLESMLALVAAGFGVSHAPASIGATPRAGVVAAPLARPRVPTGIGMVYSRANRSPSLSSFLAAARRCLRSRPSASDEARKRTRAGTYGPPRG